MAETKSEAKSPKAKAEKKPAGPKAEAAKAAKKSAAAAAPAAPPKRGNCTAEKCTQPLRAKGYCRKHFMAWRRARLGAHHHYKICSKEACRKKREFGGLCAEHAGKGQPAEGAGTPS
jgi:hypothetical protein